MEGLSLNQHDSQQDRPGPLRPLTVKARRGLSLDSQDVEANRCSLSPTMPGCGYDAKGSSSSSPPPLHPRWRLAGPPRVPPHLLPFPPVGLKGLVVSTTTAAAPSSPCACPPPPPSPLSPPDSPSLNPYPTITMTTPTKDRSTDSPIFPPRCFGDDGVDLDSISGAPDPGSSGRSTPCSVSSSTLEDEDGWALIDVEPASAIALAA